MPFERRAQPPCSRSYPFLHFNEHPFIDFADRCIKDRFVHQCGLEEWNSYREFVTRDARTAHRAEEKGHFFVRKTAALPVHFEVCGERHSGHMLDDQFTRPCVNKQDGLSCRR